MARKKIGRNHPCPCGSGKKYKKCHGNVSTAGQASETFLPNEEFIRRKLQEHEISEKERTVQQGLGRPIISTELNGYRIVAVGSKIHWSKNWRTFHDFLMDYIKIVLTGGWGNSELKKPMEERHPIIQWYDMVCAHQRATIKNPSEVVSAGMTGAVAAYLGLAYNLYLLAHNVEVQRRLIARLKNPDGFHGAYYETFVAAGFIKAGFDIELENEGDGKSTHCEFTAIHPSGRRYSVEAKARHVPGILGVRNGQGSNDNSNLRIGRRLHKALSKHADHTRIVFIDVNVPDSVTDDDEVAWLSEALNSIRSEEATMVTGSDPAPEAYVFVTNLPYHHKPDSGDFRVAVLGEGFKIPDFKIGAEFASLRDAVESRDRHSDMYDLIEFLRNQQVPSTFTGEIPEYEFGQIKTPRVKIGQKYLVPTEDGREVPGILTDALVFEDEKIIYGTYHLENDKAIIATCPISDEELAAFRQHPDTFFGVYKPHKREAKDALELYDFFYDTYRHSSKEKLLEFMAEAPEIDELRKLSQEELAKLFCERSVYGAMKVAS
ncbi:MAG: SEC-C metal-binding domain-containing protein [Proteobacteria bacterium]|nr:SEC-C metal-binding domain-containing protein [Pseudomonadota bacterium]MDA1023859.1 SEC-C metal-binding domain-containing protein [Pseudomonadota bacterium]